MFILKQIQDHMLINNNNKISKHLSVQVEFHFLTGKYREFHKLYEDGDFYAAAELLLQLLTARVAPQK